MEVVLLGLAAIANRWFGVLSDMKMNDAQEDGRFGASILWWVLKWCFFLSSALCTLLAIAASFASCFS